MPSQLHETIILLFRNRPALAPELLREALGVAVPPYSEVRLDSADLTDVAPTEYRADLVVLLVEGRPVLGIVVEVQLARDERKRFSWPVYVTTLRARLECPCVLLVVAPTETTARWAGEPIELGGESRVVPCALGQDGVPVVTDPERAKHDPELAVLSAIAHGGGDAQVAVSIALAAAGALAELDEERRVLYFDLIEAALGEAARKAFEMLPQGYEFQGPSYKRGHDEGHDEGQRLAVAANVLEVLEVRGLEVPVTVRQRVQACKDLDALKRWHRRAIVVRSAEELLEE
jgi:hypothetical protein